MRHLGANIKEFNLNQTFIAGESFSLYVSNTTDLPPVNVWWNTNMPHGQQGINKTFPM